MLKVHIRSQNEVMMKKEEHEEDFDQDNRVLLSTKNQIAMHDNEY
jgi:hypothetical protein